MKELLYLTNEKFKPIYIYKKIKMFVEIFYADNFKSQYVNINNIFYNS